MTEVQIKNMMTTLGISRDEAIEIIKEDEAIDRMDMKHVDDDLTPEQKKVKKKATNTTGDKTKRAYTFTKRERKPDDVKREIIATIAQNLDRCCFGEELSTVTDVVILKPEREITFKVNDTEFSITLIKHRKPKGE